MKAKLLIFALVFASTIANAQFNSYSDTVTFGDGLPFYFTIDTTQTNNLWQIGHPSKVIFNSAWIGDNALMTDTLNLFPGGNKSSFTIHLNMDTMWTWGCIGDGHMVFRHRYDFDSLLAGGYIEIRYFNFFDQQWTDWVNVLNDSLPIYATLDPGEYPADTITGGIPAYTGGSDGWKLAEFEWMWMMLVKKGAKDIFMDKMEIRFTALSSFSAGATEGWMIDNMDIYLYQCTGSVEEHPAKSFSSTPSPNPGQYGIRIQTDQIMAESLTLEVFHQDGRIMEKLEFAGEEPIILQSQHYPSGMYMYRLTTRSGKVSQGRFIKL